MWQQAQAKGYQLVTTADELAAASWKKPILGAFGASNLDLEWVGPTPTAAGTDPSVCQVNAARTRHPAAPGSTWPPRPSRVLDKQTQGQKKGFFLQIEGASIDKQDHAANPCGQIGETVAFDAAVKVALRYQREHPDTLVVVTADHGHTSQIVEAGTTTTGVTATLTTHDGADMTISYATTAYPGSQQHTRTIAGRPLDLERRVGRRLHRGETGRAAAELAAAATDERQVVDRAPPDAGSGSAGPVTRTKRAGMDASTGFALPRRGWASVVNDTAHRRRTRRVRPVNDMQKAPTESVGALQPRSPDGIRTRATALRGRRARPLHNGAVGAGARPTRSLSRTGREPAIQASRWGTRTRT